MLQRLHISHYALIDELDISLADGFSVLTGETGAGKSIILGAIGLLCGQRADAKALRQGERRCVVEAVFQVEGLGLEEFFSRNDFDFDGHECILRRELTAGGKSRGFINDSPAQLAQMRELGGRLVDIHSQHQNLLVGEEGFRLGVVDLVAGNEELRKAYAQTFSGLRQAEKELAEAREADAKSRGEEDYLRFQCDQLAEAGLRPGEQAELEAEADVLAHAEEIKAGLTEASAWLENEADEADGLQRVKSAVAALRSVEKAFPAAEELAERLHSCWIELKDVADELASRADDVEFRPQRLEEVNDRLNLLYALEKKHRVDTDEDLARIADDLQARLLAIDHSEERIAELEARCNALLSQARKEAEALSDSRAKAGREVAQRMAESLQPLGMPHVRFEVEVDRDLDRLGPTGADRVGFLFSANRSGSLQRVEDVASGGEIARVMLALKWLMTDRAQLPTIVFDEIDTGVSGAVAEKMARMMQDMARQGRQVVSITHLPQIAALGQAHYRVYKDERGDATTSHIALLGPDERVEELAHMLSGEKLTAAAVENARTLLGMN